MDDHKHNWKSEHRLGQTPYSPRPRSVEFVRCECGARGSRRVGSSITYVWSPLDQDWIME